MIRSLQGQRQHTSDHSGSGRCWIRNAIISCHEQFMYFHQIIYKRLGGRKKKATPSCRAPAHQGSLKQNRPKTTQNASYKARKKLRTNNAKHNKTKQRKLNHPHFYIAHFHYQGVPRPGFVGTIVIVSVFACAGFVTESTTSEATTATRYWAR